MRTHRFVNPTVALAGAAVAGVLACATPMPAAAAAGFDVNTSSTFNRASAAGLGIAVCSELGGPCDTYLRLFLASAAGCLVSTLPILKALKIIRALAKAMKAKEGIISFALSAFFCVSTWASYWAWDECKWGPQNYSYAPVRAQPSAWDIRFHFNALEVA